MIAEVRVLGRVLDQITEQIRGKPQAISGGLLLGSRMGPTVIERALPCPNVGDDGSYAIAPQVLVNVRRSLGEGAVTLLGEYRGRGSWVGSVGSVGSADDEPGAGALRLEVVADAEDCSWKLHLLESGAGTIELPAEVIRPEPRLLAACPE